MSIKKLSNNCKTLINLVFLLFIALSFSGCVKNQQSVGYTFKYSTLDEIEVGKTRKAVVKRKLGSPSAKSDYGSETWYYISTEYEKTAFLKPEILRQEVYAITFDVDQTVKEIQTYSKYDAKDINFEGEITKTEGNEISILQQLLGNVGRFNPDQKK